MEAGTEEPATATGEDATSQDGEAQPAAEGDDAAPEGEEAPADDEQAPASDEDAAAQDDAEEQAADAGSEQGPAVALLADADAANGEAIFRRCQACHTVDEGGQNRVGPNLHGIVNRPVASAEGFSYSDAMTEYASGDAAWDYGRLDAFLLAPRDEVQGTSMAFPGLRDDADRADLIAFLRSNAAEPAPLPGE
nr:cytochrome c family protein [Pararhizobium haloflavum]